MTIVNYFNHEGKKAFKCFKWSYEAEKFIKEIEAQGLMVDSIEKPFGM